MAKTMETAPAVLSDQVKRDVEAARAVAKSRLSAPEIKSRDRMLPRKELIHLYAPECEAKGRRKAAWHPFCDEPKQHARNVSRGYEPVIDPQTGLQVVDESGDRLYKLPMKLHERNMKEVSDRSARITGGPQNAESHSDGVSEKIEVVTTDADNFEEAAREVAAATD